MINEATTAVAHILKHDPIVTAFVGLDSGHKVRVYEEVAKQDEIPPFIVFQYIPGPAPVGHYHDLHAIESPQFQVTAWGRTKKETRQLFDAIQEAFELADIDVELTPYNLLRATRVGGTPEFIDQATGWAQIPATYEVVIAR